MGITARKRHTFRVNKSSESRIIALTYNILEGLGGVGVRARAAGHAPARMCAWLGGMSALVGFGNEATGVAGQRPRAGALEGCHPKHIVMSHTHIYIFRGEVSNIDATGRMIYLVHLFVLQHMDCSESGRLKLHCNYKKLHYM